MNIKILSDSTCDLSQELVEKFDVAIDATVGNGYDTLFLAEHFNKVIGIDIQPLAIKRSKEKTKDFFKKLNPVICDILPLTLEEIFAYEMETLEYSFDISLTGMED